MLLHTENDSLRLHRGFESFYQWLLQHSTLSRIKKKATVKFLSCFSKLGTRLPKANASVLAEQGKGRRDAAL